MGKTVTRQPRFVLYRDRKKQWRWKLIGTNGRKIACAGEAYRNRGDCLANIKLLYGASEFPIESPAV